jgi:hypothetical protein
MTGADEMVLAVWASHQDIRPNEKKNDGSHSNLLVPRVQSTGWRRPACDRRGCAAARKISYQAILSGKKSETRSS